MIDPGTGKSDRIKVGIDPAGEHIGCTLHRVAQSGGWDKCLALDGTTKHCHRVGVVQQYSLRAMLLHVAHDLHHRRQGAHEAEDPAGSARISHIDIHSKLFRDLDVMPPDYPCSCQYGSQNDIGAFEASTRFRVAFTLAGYLPNVDDLFSTGQNPIVQDQYPLMR